MNMRMGKDPTQIDKELQALDRIATALEGLLVIKGNYGGNFNVSQRKKREQGKRKLDRIMDEIVNRWNSD